MKLNFNFDKVVGRVKPMHATNNGPRKGVGFGRQATNGFKLWEEAGIPYVRTHDSSFCSVYGGAHTVDIYAVFPNFYADVNDPASYDFPVTDNYMKQITDCGSKVFYRLGSKIEHEVKKYNTLDDACEDVREILLELNGDEEYEMLLLDSTHDAESVGSVSSGMKIKLMPNTVCLLKTK